MLVKGPGRLMVVIVPAGDVVEEGVAHGGVAGVPVADELVAEGRVADRVEGVGGAAQRRELLAGRVGAVEEIAEIAAAVGRCLVAAGAAHDAAGRAEAQPVGRVGGGAGEVDGWRRGVGVGRRGERRQGVEHAGGGAAGTDGKVAGHAVAANAGDRGHHAAGVAEGRVVERLSQRCRRDGTEKRCSQPGRRANPADADAHLLPQTLRARFGLLLLVLLLRDAAARRIRLIAWLRCI